MITESKLIAPGDAGVSPVLVSVCGPDGYTPEQWANMAMTQIIAIADTAPQPLRDQAYAFREHAMLVIAETVRQALNEARMKRRL